MPAVTPAASEPAVHTSPDPTAPSASRLLATLLPLQDSRAAVAGHRPAAKPLAVRRTGRT